MACCGQNRQRFSGAGAAHSGRERPDESPGVRRSKRYAYAYFQYLGKTALTVIGPISGKRYRFANHGAIVAVDPNDRRSLSHVPGLRQVRK